ncbi:MAG: hypothetical protein JNL94_05010, partial [Planctomycetes bacterium]|nr:hypothetical protein [Planctomycetota bacterium]
LVEKADLTKTLVKDVMKEPLPEVDLYAPLEEVSRTITRKVPAVLVRLNESSFEIITKFDLLQERR